MPNRHSRLISDWGRDALVALALCSPAGFTLPAPFVPVSLSSAPIQPQEAALADAASCAATTSIIRRAISQWRWCCTQFRRITLLLGKFFFTMLTWLASNATGLSIIGATIAFIWPVAQFVITRRRDLQFREFETYHRLIKELVAPDPQEKVLWVDRQAAIVFELRHFPRYYDFSGRTLRALRAKWTADPEFKFPRLIEEIDLTLDFLSKNRG